MNTQIISIMALVVVGLLMGSSEAMKSTPFEYQATGVEITDFDLDFKDIEIILDVEVTKPLATMEIAFEREFFDSKSSGTDDDFTIIADGELVYYKELETTLQHRTIEFHLLSGTDEVEIFGTQIMGLPINEIEEKPQEPQPVFNDQTKTIEKLSNENEKLKAENKFLQEENERLDSRIFELENLVSALELQVSNLNAVVVEQVKVIYNWVLGYSPI